MKILEKLNFVPYSIGNNIWIKYKQNTRQIKWMATFTVSGKILLKDDNDNIILSTKDKEEFESFLIQEDRNDKLNNLLGN